MTQTTDEEDHTDRRTVSKLQGFADIIVSRVIAVFKGNL